MDRRSNSEGFNSIDFFSNGLCTHCHMAKNELTRLLVFHQLTEESWEQKDKELQNRIDEILKDYPEEDHGEIVSDWGLDLHMNQVLYPSIHRESLIITLHNFLEDTLNRLCEILVESNQIKLQLKDMSGLGVERALKFLSKVSGMDLSDMSPELPFLKGVNHVRNLIVHAGGILPKDEKNKAYKFISSLDSIRGTPGYGISVNSEFIGIYIEHMKEFFDKLERKTQRYIKEFNEANPNR